MTITCYSNFSKKPNSTKQPTGGTVFTCTLKQPTSVIHPVFILTTSNAAFNYIKWDSRYYFVDDIVLTHNNYTEYHCSVDVMASWKTQIGSSEEYVVRAASAYNPSIIDKLYPVRADEIGSAQTLSGIDSYLTITSGSFVVGVVGSQGAASGSIAYYLLTAAEFNNVINYLFGGTWLDTTEADITLATQKELVNPFQYIVSCMWYPFSVATLNRGTNQDFHFGWWVAEYPGVPGAHISAKLLDVQDRYLDVIDAATLPSHPEASARGDYLNGYPFTRHTAYIGPFGKIPIDPMPFVSSHTMQVRMQVDLFTGASKIIFANSDGSKPYNIQYGTVGVPVQLSQVSQAPMHAVIDVLGGAVAAGYGNVLGFASGVASALEDLMPKAQVSGSTGSAVDFLMHPVIVSEFIYQSPMDAVHNGRPLCQNKVINTLSGYIKCENAEIDIPATQEERDAINAYMNSGFYYE